MSLKSATPMQPNSIPIARNKMLTKSGTLLFLRQAPRKIGAGRLTLH